MAPSFAERLVLLVGAETPASSSLAVALIASRFRLERIVDVLAARERLADDESRRPDLVLLDMAGHRSRQLSLLRWLRAGDPTANLPVVVLTGRHGGRDIRAALSAGADAYLTRPIRPSVLLACVQGVLRHPPEVAGAPPTAAADSQESVDLFGRDPRRVPHLPGETDDFHSSEWAIFKGIQAAMGRCLQSGSPLTIVMIHVTSLRPLDEAERGRFQLQAGQVIRHVLPTDAALKLFERDVYCAVLPETAEPAALARVRRVIDALGAGPVPIPGKTITARVSCGVAVVQPPFSCSPFRLIDQSRQALEEAATRDACGFWVVHPEVAR